MLLHSNIDKTDAAINTNAPFMGHCACMLGDTRLSPGSFLSIKIYLSEDMVPPARLSKVTKTAITFTDADGVFIGTVRLVSDAVMAANGYPYVSALIYNENNVIAGHVTTTPTAVKELQAAANFNGGSIDTNADDFMLLPQCHVATFRGGIRSFLINGEHITSDVILRAGSHVYQLTQATNLHDITDVQMHLLKAFTSKGKTHGIRKVGIQTADGTITCYDDIEHVLVSADKLSNLRVTMQDNAVLVKGVLDD